jgi:serine/threonine-protein kinase HipA
MCQATGTSAIFKHESDGGPGIQQIMGILAGSERARGDQSNFFTAQIIFWILAAIDGHAKNFSIAHLASNRYVATPLYDVLSAHPIMGNGRNEFSPRRVKLAMSVRSRNAHYFISEIRRRHWVAQGQRATLATEEVEEMIDTITGKTEAVIENVAAQLPKGFPQDVSEKIFDGMRRQSKKLAA